MQQSQHSKGRIDMLYRQLFIDAISDVLHDIQYRLVGNSFYIYKREIGVVICIGFDVFMGGSNFIIYGGAESVCSDIELLPNGKLPIGCYDVNVYAQRYRLPAFTNLNINPTDGAPKRYSKALLVPKLQQNLMLLKERLLPDLLRIESMEDYYNFKVRADGMMNAVAIPFPTIHTFYLCIFLGLIEPASHIYLRMHQRDDGNIAFINDHMKKDSRKKMIDVLECTQSRYIVLLESFEQYDTKAKAIETVLRENQESLKVEAQKRIERSTNTLNHFFSE